MYRRATDHEPVHHRAPRGPLRGAQWAGDVKLQGRRSTHSQHHLVPQRAAGRHRQRGPDRRPDVVAERPAVLPQSYGTGQGTSAGYLGCRRLLLQRHEPGDRVQRHQSKRVARSGRYAVLTVLKMLVTQHNTRLCCNCNVAAFFLISLSSIPAACTMPKSVPLFNTVITSTTHFLT